MPTGTPPSRSERLLRSTLERSPLPSSTSPTRAHRRRHSHVPVSLPPTDDEEHHQHISRAAFLYRTAATAASPIHPHHNQRHSPSPSRPASPSLRPVSPSPSSHRRPLQRSPASDGNLSLQRHNSTPGKSRKKPASLAEPLPLTPHEQVLRARLERVLSSGRVVDDRERSRERRRSVNPERDHREDAPGWPWSEKEHHATLASTPPKSSTSGSSDHHLYLYHQYQQQHHRSRSKTDPVPSVPPTTPATPRRATAATTVTVSPYSPYSQSRHNPSTRSPLPSRNNSNSSSTGMTPPLTADHSPVFGQLGESLIQQQQQPHIDADDVRFLTPPPTPPLVDTYTPGSGRHSLYRTRSSESQCPPSPYSYLYQRREAEERVERLDLGLGVGHPSTMAATFNARKASERCRMMEGYVSFANVEGLGTPPDGVDDHEEQEEGKDGGDDRRGRGIGVIGGWAKRLFVGISSNGNASTPVA